MTYQHRQNAPLYMLLLVLAVVMAGSAWVSRFEPGVAPTLLGAAVLIVLVGMGMQYLEVRDEGEHLVLRYGPLPLFRRRFAYTEMTEAEPGRSRLIDGWGIHYAPGRGWTYNLWGTSCVVLRVRGRVVRIGTDDAEGLAEFLRGRIGKRK